MILPHTASLTVPTIGDDGETVYTTPDQFNLSRMVQVAGTLRVQAGTLGGSTPGMTVQFQGRNDASESWRDLPGTTAELSSAGSDTIPFPVGLPQFVRVKITMANANNTATGTVLTAWCSDPFFVETIPS